MSDRDDDSELNENERQTVLSKLQEFGDSLLDDNDYKRLKEKQKKKFKKQQNNDTAIVKKQNSFNLPKLEDVSTKTLSIDKTTLSTNSQKAQKDRKQNVTSKNKRKRNHLDEFKESLKLDSVKLSKNGESEITVCDTDVYKNTNSPDVIVFEDPAKKRKKALKQHTVHAINDGPPKHATKNQDRNDSAFHSARHDVLKFGLSGFSKDERDTAQVQLAIRLGAKPPKNKYVNYKKLMEMKIQKKSEEKDFIDAVPSKQAKEREKAGSRKGKKKDSTIDGQVGVYRRGVQKLSREDIQKIKTTRVKSK